MNDIEAEERDRIEAALARIFLTLVALGFVSGVVVGLGAAALRWVWK